MIFEKLLETQSRDKLEALQSERLVSLIERVYARVPYYKEQLDAADVKPSDIKSVKDLHKLPFTTKEDLRKNYPFGLFTVPMDEVVRVRLYEERYRYLGHLDGQEPGSRRRDPRRCHP